MMWDVVLTAWRAMIVADPTILGALGSADRVHLSRDSRKLRVPSIEYTVIDDREEELFNPIRVQVDVFAEDEAQCALLERTVRRLTHRDTARDLGGYRMWTRFLDARSHPYAHDPECVHRSTDFEFVPLRERYATP